MLTRADVERITENLLSELRLEITDDYATGTKSIRLMFRGKVIDQKTLTDNPNTKNDDR